MSPIRRTEVTVAIASSQRPTGASVMSTPTVAGVSSAILADPPPPPPQAAKASRHAAVTTDAAIFFMVILGGRVPQMGAV